MKQYEKFGLFMVLIGLSIGMDTAVQEIVHTILVLIGGAVFMFTLPKE